MHVKDPANFRRKRMEKHYTQRDLAFLVRRTQTTIYAIEKGTLRNITEDLAIALAARLDTPWEDLFEAHEALAMTSVPNGTSSTAVRPVHGLAKQR